MNIAVAGAGFVGLSIATLLSKKNNVKIYDILDSKIEMINKGVSPIHDDLITDYLNSGEINLMATNNTFEAYLDADYVVIATPTNYDPKTNFFDTSSVESAIKQVLEVNDKCTIVIKSTIPIGYTKQLKKNFNNNRILFSPEFLREGTALYDNLYPSRIIVGEISERAEIFANLLKDSAKKDVDIIFTDSSEAEAIKLFSNTYLAMRVAFFNELDNFAISKKLNAEQIILGVGYDSRIGSHYNNPSFGYGGYCFPKDTKQLLANFKNVPNDLISAVVKSNSTRKDFIVNEIIKKKPKVVGVHRIIMKEGSDNYRSSAIIGIINRLNKNGIKIIIFEPTIDTDYYDDFEIINDIENFKSLSDLIIANRLSHDLNDIPNKVFTRDIFNSDK
jgi:UDPglucose 6-dehydrogenase